MISLPTRLIAVFLLLVQVLVAVAPNGVMLCLGGRGCHCEAEVSAASDMCEAACCCCAGRSGGERGGDHRRHATVRTAPGDCCVSVPAPETRTSTEAGRDGRPLERAVAELMLPAAALPAAWCAPWPRPRAWIAGASHPPGSRDGPTAAAIASTRIQI